VNIVKTRGFEIVSDQYRKHPDKEIILPTRATKHSAGIDFYSPITIDIQPGEKQVIWTDIKAYMCENEVLMLYIRSSIGIKKYLTLANSVAVIDGDYYQNKDNDGNIGVCLFNNSIFIKTIEVGERICQGVFMNYLVADNSESNSDRIGGIGSSN